MNTSSLLICPHRTWRAYPEASLSSAKRSTHPLVVVVVVVVVVALVLVLVALALVPVVVHVLVVVAVVVVVTLSPTSLTPANFKSHKP